MITFQQARQIAESKIKDVQLADQDTLTIIEDLTIEKEYAWISQYTSSRFLETEDLSFAIAGNSPLFITKFSGQLFTYRTGLTIEQMIDQFEEDNKIWNLSIRDNALSDTSKLKFIKHICKLTIADIANLKSERIIGIGARQKLLDIQNQLISKNIKTDLYLATISTQT